MQDTPEKRVAQAVLGRLGSWGKYYEGFPTSETTTRRWRKADALFPQGILMEFKVSDKETKSRAPQYLSAAFGQLELYYDDLQRRGLADGTWSLVATDGYKFVLRQFRDGSAVNEWREIDFDDLLEIGENPRPDINEEKWNWVAKGARHHYIEHLGLKVIECNRCRHSFPQKDFVMAKKSRGLVPLPSCKPCHAQRVAQSYNKSLRQKTSVVAG